MTKRLDPLFVKNAIESEGFLLHNTYETALTKLQVTCKHGHTNLITWASWYRGRRCKTCSSIRFADSLKHDPDYIKTSIEAKGWVLHDTYTGTKVKMQATCPQGHNVLICWDSFNTGKGCTKCANLARGSYRKLDGNVIKKNIESEGYILHSEYKNSQTHLSMTCPNGHTSGITWSNWDKGKRCGKCYGHHKTTEEVSKVFADEMYTLLSEYKTNNQKLNFICPNGHYHSITWADWISGCRCAKCADYGFNPNKNASLYYLRFVIEGLPYYKLGITNRTIEERYAREHLPYTVLYEHRYLLGSMARAEESKLIKKHKKHLYNGTPILKDGNTELFTRDVLKLDRC